MTIATKLLGWLAGFGLGIPDLIILAIAVGAALWLYKRGKKEMLKQLAYYLVTQAEKHLGAGTGELKYNLAITELYARMPVILRWIVSKKEIDELIEGAVTKLKDYLASGKTLDGLDTEKVIGISNEQIGINAGN